MAADTQLMPSVGPKAPPLLPPNRAPAPPLQPVSWVPGPPLEPDYPPAWEGPTGPQGPPGPASGVDVELRAYIQQIMAVLDPGGPPPP